MLVSYEGMMGPAEAKPDVHLSPAARGHLGEGRGERVDPWETRVGVTGHGS